MLLKTIGRRDVGWECHPGFSDLSLKNVIFGTSVNVVWLLCSACTAGPGPVAQT